MSIVVLKKKSLRFKLGESISGKGKNGFSLNGGRRSQGWVGQDLRGRHLSRTIYRGLEPVGHGGTNGKYVKHILGQPSCSANNPNIIKRSTMSTPGRIATTYIHPTSIFNFDCSGNCRTVMVSVAPQVPDYSIYIAAKAQATMFCDNIITDGSGSQVTCYTDRYIDDKFIPGCKTSRRIGGKKRPLTRYFKDMRGAETGSWFNEYRVKHNNCLPPPLCKAPWPTTVSRKCQNNYLTAAEAMAAGALPADWMNCLPGTRPGKTNYAFSSYSSASSGSGEDFGPVV